jgi:UV excision repair protein RAD23
MSEIKVVVQTLKNDKHDLNVNLSDTVEVLKQQISQLPLNPAIPTSGMRVIHSGTILDDDQKTLEAAGITEQNNLLVVMTVRKKRAKGKKKKAKKSAPAPEPTPEPTEPTPEPTPEPQSTAAPTPAPEAATSMETSDDPSAVPTPSVEAASESKQDSSNASASAASAMVSGEALNETITMLMGLGDFSVDQVRAALRAAYNNPNTAAQYLLEGIPPQLLQAQAQAQAPPQAQVPPQGPQGFSQGQGQGQGQAPPQPQMGGGGMGMGGMGDEAGFLQMLQQNPQMMQLVMAMQQNPQLAAQVEQNPALLMQMIQAMQQRGGGGAGGGMPGMGGAQGQGGHGGPQRVQITLSEEERNQIQYLQNLAPGITQQMALEAFLACDRNQELAANFLLDQLYQ